jgi:hypothetical protein
VESVIVYLIAILVLNLLAAEFNGGWLGIDSWCNLMLILNSFRTMIGTPNDVMSELILVMDVLSKLCSWFSFAK